MTGGGAHGAVLPPPPPWPYVNNYEIRSVHSSQPSYIHTTWKITNGLPSKALAGVAAETALFTHENSHLKQTYYIRSIIIYEVLYQVCKTSTLSVTEKTKQNKGMLTMGGQQEHRTNFTICYFLYTYSTYTWKTIHGLSSIFSGGGGLPRHPGGSECRPVVYARRAPGGAAAANRRDNLIFIKQLCIRQGKQTAKGGGGGRE